jgi:hypothetical protein
MFKKWPKSGITLKPLTKKRTYIMKNMLSGVVSVVACTLAFTVNVAAAEKLLTDQDLEILRANARLDKANVIKDYMQFNAEEAQAFWPIYNEYSAMNKVKIGDERVKLISDYVKNRKQLSDEQAKELVEKSLKLQEEKMDLLKKYYDKMVEAVGAKRAVEWFQINQYVDQIYDLAITGQVPLALGE